MPAVLERCVQEVMAKGHDQSSAFAICRTSLGLSVDGSQDEQAPALSDAEMRAKVSMSMAVGNGPILRKRMPLTEAVGDFQNGDQSGSLDLALLRQLVANQKKLPRQIPVYLITGTPNPDHPTDLDEMLADGWVEGFSVEGDRLVGDVKLHGNAAAAIIKDQVRGASIGTIAGKTYDGKPLGQVLAHVVLTNSPFVKGMNVAARSADGAVAFHFTDLSKEAAMADDKKDKPKPAAEAKADDTTTLTEKLTAAEVLLQEKEGQIRDLTASNANLLEEVAAFRKNPQLDIAMKEVDKLKRVNLAEKVRRITAKMITDGQIATEALRGWFDHDSDEVVLAGFKNSQFKGDLNLLEYHRASVPKKPGNRQFISGVPTGDGGTVYTAEEKQQIRDMGKDPELLEKTRGARNLTEYRRLKAAAKG